MYSMIIIVYVTLVSSSKLLRNFKQFQVIISMKKSKTLFFVLLTVVLLIDFITFTLNTLNVVGNSMLVVILFY